MELANQFWREFEYRHKSFWLLFRQCILVHTALLSVPFFLLQQKISVLFAIVPFVLAIVLAILSFKLLQAEASRMGGSAVLHRHFVTQYLDDAEKDKYLISRFAVDKFKINVDLILFKHSIDVEAISKASLAQQIPVYWVLYGVSAPVLMILWVIILRSLDIVK